MRVSYPLKDISTDAEAKNYFGHRNLFGKYPIGAHNAWHGGIHLEGDCEEIQCIANGRIIAYRFAKDYKTTKINNIDHLYSNGFVLIQHDYKSKEKQKMTFYSLYHHLMPEIDINSAKNSAKIPKFLSKSETVYTAKGTEGIVGLNARTLKDNKIDYNDDATIAVVIGKGETVNLDPLTDSKINTGNYKRISYTGRDGKIYTDIYILTSKNNTLKVERVKKITESTLEITTPEDKDLTIKGARVRKNKDSYVVKIIPKGEIIDIEETEEEWKKLKDGSGYIHTSVFNTETKNTFDDSKGKKDEIIACDIPIKAGTTIGYTGNFGFKGFKGYKASHLEVFTTDDVCEFLSNEKNDGEEEQYFTNIEVGAKLKTSLSYKVDIKNNTPVKVLNIEGDYAQIKTTNIEGIVKKSLLGGYKSATGGSYYAISSDNISKLNPSFNNALPSDLKKLYWVNRCDSSGNNLTKNEENIKIANAKKLKKTYISYRKVTYKPKTKGTFWIEKTSIAKITEKIKKERDLFALVIPEYLLTEEQKYDTVVREAKTGEKTTLYGDVCKAYIEIPFRTDVEEVTVEKEKLVDLRKFKKAKDDKKDLWYKVILDYTTSSQCVTAEGWIKEKDLKKFSAYNWKKFGFKDVDAGNEYIYSLKDLRKATDSDPFVKAVWDKAIDEDGNKILDAGELSKAFTKPEVVQKISRLVCKHKNEWSYTMAEIKPEVKELYDFGIQMEEDAADKQKLETERDASLAKMETKIKDLMWWDEAKAKPYTAPVKEETTPKAQSNKRPSILPDDEKEEATTPKTVVDAKQVDAVPLNGTTAPKNEGTTNNNNLIFPVGLNATTIKGANQVPATTKPDTKPAGGEPVETKKEEKEKPPERMFPSTNIVHHFHPIAWVEQMKRMYGDCKVLKKGDKSELVREINIRLAGFGGNVPTDEFTQRTVNMVKQFQKDYMKVEQTGVVCGKMFKAIDEFSEKYSIPFEQIKCKCGTCTGFGQGKFTSQKQNKSIKEKNRKYEYPGIHRTLLWTLKSTMFYLANSKPLYNLKFGKISSGYRCHIDNQQHSTKKRKRKSTNHMGKALDVHFYKKNSTSSSEKNCDIVRDKVLINKSGAQLRWKNNNKISLEPSKKDRIGSEFIATTWVHYDVREFELKFLKDEFFIKKLNNSDENKIQNLAKKEGYDTECNCDNIANDSTTDIDRNFTIEDGKNALKSIYDKYGKDMAIIVERMYRDETRHFKSSQYKKTGTGGMESHGAAPYYGWSSSFFEANPDYKPLGLVAFFEGKGLSALGGNEQITDKKKKFVVMPSVEAAMEYKVNYINKYDGDYARWHSTNETAKTAYKTHLSKIIPRFVNEFEK